MNATGLPQTPPNFLTVRVGCALGYEADEPTTIFLLIQPRLDPHGVVIHEELTFGNGQHIERLIDPHGNHVLKTMLVPGLNEIRHDMTLSVPDQSDNHGLQSYSPVSANLPYDVLRYTLPSRYCESDKLATWAEQTFGQYAQGFETAEKICDWTYRNIEYRYGSGDSTLSACEALDRRYGVCRDFAHVMIALCRALGMPARYVAGHMAQLDAVELEPNSDIGVDFHAYVEVYLGDAWHIFDPRHNKPHTGRIKVAHGMDAVDVAFATFSGNVRPVHFKVWAYSVLPAAAAGGLYVLSSGSGCDQQGS